MRFQKHSFLNPVSAGASLLILLIFGFSVFFPRLFKQSLMWIQQIFIFYFSWFYTVVIFGLFCFCVYLLFSPYGKIRLGLLRKPKYSTLTWLSMLFSAGMGTGLLFSGVYEPLYHYVFPPEGLGSSLESLRLSFQLTFLHWGFSGWVVYTFTGLLIAYFCFQKKLPLKVSSMLYPFLKEKIKSPLGAGIDIIAVTAILFGIAASLGRGTMQINSGLDHLFNIPVTSLNQGLIITVITFLAAVSVLSGLNRGIRRLSEVNVILCCLLLVFMLTAGPTTFLLNSFVEYTGLYFQNFISSMTRVESLGSTQWRSQWTLLYWAWWIAWAPFVGLFIAKISEGRTIKEFILGCLFAPALLSFLWFTVFGGSAVYYHHIENTMNLEPFLKTNYSVLFFKFLEHFPFSSLTSCLALTAVAVFFITSSDSASYVLHQISSDSKTPARMNKIYWSSLEGFLALMLVFSGGIHSLELLVIVTAFPFALLLCWISFGFFKSLKSDASSS